jgi:ABC-type molybdate transport system permease subunit
VHLVQNQRLIKSEKLDDYSVTYADTTDGSRETSSFFGIPMLEEYKAIIEKYAGTYAEQMGSFGVTLS